MSGDVTFTFSNPVAGFGIWVFDNSSSSDDSFVMLANGATSGVLDSNPGSTAHAVEGFLGVTDAAGLSSVTIRNLSGNIAFELDHMQISAIVPIPEPASLVLLGLCLGLSGVAVAGRRRWKKAA